MIFELSNTPVRSELRKYLATAIKTRIESVFEPVGEKWPDTLSRRMLIITDSLQRDIVDILGICIKIDINVEFDWSQVRDAPEDSPGHKLYQMYQLYKQLVGENEHTQGNDIMEVHEGEMRQDSGPTPPSAFAGLSPGAFFPFE